MHFAVFGSSPIHGRELACFEAGTGEAFAKRLRRIVPHHERLLRFRGQSLPKLIVERRHKEIVARYLPKEKSARSRDRFGL